MECALHLACAVADGSLHCRIAHPTPGRLTLRRPMLRRRRGVIRQCVIDNDFAGRAKRARTAIDEIISGLGVAMHRPSTIEEGGERRLRRMSGQELAKTLEWLRQKPIEGLPSVLSRLSNCVHTADAIVPEWCGIQTLWEMATDVFRWAGIIREQATGGRGVRTDTNRHR